MVLERIDDGLAPTRGHGGGHGRYVATAKSIVVIVLKPVLVGKIAHSPLATTGHCAAARARHTASFERLERIDDGLAPARGHGGGQR